MKMFSQILLPSFTCEAEIKSHKRLAIQWLFFTAKPHRSVTLKEICKTNFYKEGKNTKVQKEKKTYLCNPTCFSLKNSSGQILKTEILGRFYRRN